MFFSLKLYSAEDRPKYSKLKSTTDIMLKLKLTIGLVIGVLQLCTANPISSEQDVTKLFSADELQRAREAQIPDYSLIEGKAYGLTIEEIIRLHPLKSAPDYEKSKPTFNFVDKVCKVVLPDHQTATNYSSVHETHLHDLVYAHKLPKGEQHLFVRNTLCAYISQPDLYEAEANAFGSEFIPYMKIRYLKLKGVDGTVTERIQLANEMCCVLKGRNLFTFSIESTFSRLPDTESNSFVEHWNQFQSANSSKPLQNLCDFLQAKSPADECQAVLLINE